MNVFRFLCTLLVLSVGSLFAQIAPDDIQADKLQKFLQDQALEAGGDLDMSPDGVRKLLREFGVDKKELKDLDDLGIMQLLMEGLGLKRAAPFSQEALEGLDIPKGLRVEAFGKEFLKRIESKDEVDWDGLRALMVEFGAQKEGIDKLTNEELSDMLSQMMGNPPVTAEEKRIRTALRDQFDELLDGHRPAVTQAFESTVGFFDADELLCHGTVVDNRGFILSKASELKKAGELTANIHSNVHPATVVKTWVKHDLALVFVDAKMLVPVQWYARTVPPVGTFIASPNYDSSEPIGIGLLAVAPRSLASDGLPFLGIGLELDGDDVIVTSVMEDSAAEKGGLMQDDRILLLNGEKPTSTADLIAEIERHQPGDEVAVEVRRGKETQSFSIKLGSRTRQKNKLAPDLERMNEMSGESSDVRTGFPKVIQTDLPVEPNQMGGPLADLRGRVIGMNIARAGRIETYAIPAETILDLLTPLNFTALAKSQQEAESGAVTSSTTSDEDFGDVRARLEASLKALAQARHALEQAEAANLKALEELNAIR